MEVARLKAIFKPVIDEFDAWEASFTRKEAIAQHAHSVSMKQREYVELY